MKKVILATIAAAFVISPAIAGSPGSDNGVTARLTGKTSTTYNDGFFGSVTCNETQHPKFDTVECQINGAPRTDLAGQTITGSWFSDFDGTWGSITFTVNADGTGYSGKATY